FLRGHADLRLELEVRGLELRPLAVGGGTYLSLRFEGCELMSYPGKPALPFSVRVLRLPAGEGVVVGVLDAEFELMAAPFKVVPAPQPVPYGPAAAELVVAEDPSVYASHGFFPGRLLEYVWDRVGDGIVVVVRVYPVQYNPATGQLLVVRKLELGVRVADLAEAPAGGGGVFKGSAVIIAPRSLAAEAYELARVYECYGVNATVVTTEWIRETYPEAENITAYPGFYTYNGTDPVYAELVESYDWELALRIVSYLRDSAAHPDLRYVVLLGGASSVPPSFYYFHEPSADISWWDAWVPTDFFYASPDYDLVPDYVVGRIPFSDPADVSAYVGKLRRWCVGVCLARDVSWARNVVLAGGYPFLTWFMFGESLISTMSLEGHLDFFNATVLSGTGGSYNPERVKRAFLEGNASWYLLVSHGTGRSLADYAFVEPGVFVLEELVDASYV
ncbi:MAG TPA: hypothetical protein EYP90_12140, partial [Chromatiaceae bacterium]|nr:hypothetical protein [Chromatiaceae bacterium]